MAILRILLADDHDVVRSGLRLLVNEVPGLVVVGEACDGAEALAQACELKPDVVVMDVSMPELDGAAATERILQECPGVKVLALTAYEDRGHLTKMLQAGAAGYLPKRAAPNELVRAIRTIASGGTYVDPIMGGGALRKVADTTVSVRDTDPLSGREEEVLRRIAWGETNREIAASLGISTKTVETYKARITEKLGLRSRTEMVRYAVQRGWLSSN